MAIAVTSCTKICNIPRVSIVINGKEVSINDSEMPCYKVNDFTLAAKLAIKAIYSEKFRSLLDAHIKNNLGTGKHVEAWGDKNANEIVQKMQQQINNISVITYGGVKGLWVNKIYGNLAYDGTESGPIRINRIPLKRRSIASISATIAHEVAHRIGLEHPHSNENFEVAEKEPPYVIDGIIENIVEELIENKDI